jgi:hypothetical protein
VSTIGDEGAEVRRFALPVCGRVVTLRPPNGSEDLLLWEAERSPAGDTALALTLARRLTRTIDGEPLDWPGATVTDLDTVVVQLRRLMVGDRVRSDLRCVVPGCEERIDLNFQLGLYLRHHAPQAHPRVHGWTAEPDDLAGWFRLVPPRQRGDERLCFRLPTVADQLAVAGLDNAEEVLARRCLRPFDAPARLRRHAEALMEAMAPSLSNDLHAVCPECSAEFNAWFEARWYCLGELRQRSAYVYQDVDLLARRYHWSEEEILALPHSRRATYTELALRGGEA